MPEKSKRHLLSLVSEYEEKAKTGEFFYMEALDLLDVMDYYLKEGQTEEADACLAHALRLHPSDENVLLSKAYRLKEKGNWEEAGELVRSLSDQGMRDVQLFYIEEFLAGFSTTEAEKLFLENLQSTELSELEKHEMCISYVELLLDYDLSLRALEWLRKLPVEEFPLLKEEYAGVTQKHYYELLSEAYFQLYQYKKSIQAQERTLDIDPYDSISWEQLADVQQAAGMYEETLDSCDYALTINANASRALRNKALAHAALKQFPQLEAVVKKLREVETPDYNFYYLIGNSLSNNGAYAEAAEWLRYAVRLCPVTHSDYSRILADLVRVLTLLRKDQEALDAYLCYAMAGNCEIATALIDVAVNSFLHDNTALGLGILEKCVQELELCDEDVKRIVEQLDRFGLYAKAKSLWKKLIPMAQSIEGIEEQVSRARLIIGN